MTDSIKHPTLIELDSAPSKERAAFLSHVKDCPLCQQNRQFLGRLTMEFERDPQVVIPKKVDNHMVDLALQHAARTERLLIRRSKKKRLIASAVPFAAVACFILALVWLLPANEQVDQAVVQLPSDFNGDGVVDVLDAYRLAQIQSETPALQDTRFDVDKDNQVDGQDVTALITAIVSVQRGQ